MTTVDVPVMETESRILELRNDFAELARAHEAFGAWLHDRDAGADLQYDVDLVVEEVFTNLVKHAWPEGGEHRITLAIREDDGRVFVRFEDDGTPFDPRSAPEPNFPDDLELRRPGGLGLHLVRGVVDRMDYRVEEGTNRLSLRLRRPIRGGADERD